MLGLPPIDKNLLKCFCVFKRVLHQNLTFEKSYKILFHGGIICFPTKIFHVFSNFDNTMCGIKPLVEGITRKRC